MSLATAIAPAARNRVVLSMRGMAVVHRGVGEGLGIQPTALGVSGAPVFENRHLCPL
jgi:hypothetical protein